MTKSEIEQIAEHYINSRLSFLANTGPTKNLSPKTPYLIALRQSMTNAINEIIEEEYLLNLEVAEIAAEFDKKISEEIEGF
mgnify:CR=1 FL=1|tara:strand:+ start:198 stop:440 length:243 start_codon:yes stop_codon:yes gene_type:complete